MGGAHSGQPPHNEANQEAPKHCTGRKFNALGAVNRQPWYPERRGSGWVSSPGKLVSKTPSNNAGGTPWGLLRRHRAACGARTRAQINGIDSAWGAARPLFGNSEYLLRRAWAAGFHHRGCSHHYSPGVGDVLRRRRKNIADTGEIVVGAPPVMKPAAQALRRRYSEF